MAIIQARMGSERFPGKVLRNIGNRSVLSWVIHRARMVEGVDEVVVATTTLPEDAGIVRLCEVLGVRCHQGDPADVLARYAEVARLEQATHILRVTADCPLMCPVLAGRVVDAVKTSVFPYVGIETGSVGLAQEAFTREALELAHAEARDAGDREHVVPWMIRNLLALSLSTEQLTGRWCVDTPEDLERLRALHRETPGLFEKSAFELMELELVA